MDGSDLRKLVYQAVYGIDHLLQDEQTFQRSLQREWEGLNVLKGPVRGALQIIDPERRTGRLHLAPCKALGIALEELAAFLWSQPLKHGKQERFDRLWSSVKRLTREGRIPFDLSALDALSSSEGPTHHSKGYGPTAYRIINDTLHARVAEWLRAHGVRS